MNLLDGHDRATAASHVALASGARHRRCRRRRGATDGRDGALRHPARASRAATRDGLPAEVVVVEPTGVGDAGRLPARRPGPHRRLPRARHRQAGRARAHPPGPRPAHLFDAATGRASIAWREASPTGAPETPTTAHGGSRHERGHATQRASRRRRLIGGAARRAAGAAPAAPWRRTARSSRRRARRCASCAGSGSSRATRTSWTANTKKFTEPTGVAGAGRRRELGRPAPEDGGGGQRRHRPGHRRRLVRRPAPVSRQAAST